MIVIALMTPFQLAPCSSYAPTSRLLLLLSGSAMQLGAQFPGGKITSSIGMPSTLGTATLPFASTRNWTVVGAPAGQLPKLCRSVDACRRRRSSLDAGLSAGVSRTLTAHMEEPLALL